MLDAFGIPDAKLEQHISGSCPCDHRRNRGKIGD
jgi:hypothetical protein